MVRLIFFPHSFFLFILILIHILMRLIFLSMCYPDILYKIISVFHISGLYVSRNTYIRTGVAEWKVSNPVHLVRIYYLSLLSRILLFPLQGNSYCPLECEIQEYQNSYYSFM